MSDRIMRRVWVSPWSQFVLMVWFAVSGAYTHGFWRWCLFGGSVVSGLRFLELGKKRWGS